VKRTGTATLLALAVLASGCSTTIQSERVRLPDDERGRARSTSSGSTIAIVASNDEPFEVTRPVEPEGNPYSCAPPEDPELAAAVADSRVYYEAGREAFVRGEYEFARDMFERAVDVMLPDDAEPGPEADAVVDAVQAHIAAYEAAWAEWAGLKDVELEERDLVEGAAIEAVAGVVLPEIVTEPEPVAAAASVGLVGDMPIEVNNQVRKMLEVYKGRLRDELLPAFQRSGQFLPMIHRIFREEGVPLDLAWLSLVESGFKTTAYSRAQAKGLWQFIPSTGRMYGLKRDYWVDDRSDPYKATRAAARHLRDLHDQYGDWWLVLAAYNAGPGKVNRAIRRVGRKDYWAIARSRYLRRETKNYVPGYIATLMIAQDPEAHGFRFIPDPPFVYDSVSLDGAADLSVLARCAGSSVDELRRLNPELRRMMTPSDRRRYELRIPDGSREGFRIAWAQVPEKERLRFALHRVQRGETLGRIARRYGVGLDVIVAANSLRNRHRIHPGDQIRVPLSPGASAPPSRSRSKATSRSPKTSGYHRVRRGETLGRIAKRYGVSVRQLKSWNRLRSDRIYVGARLNVGSKAAVGTTQPSVRRASGGKTVVHEVRRGDSLWSVSARYGVEVKDLRRWNNLRSNQIHPGQRLRIKGTSGTARSGAATQVVSHSVRRGETLWSIARRYGVTIGDLARWNSQSTRTPIQVGQRLRVQVP